MSPRRAGALGLGLTVGGVVVVLLLFAMAARSGPAGVVHGRAHDALHQFSQPPPPTTSGAIQSPHKGQLYRRQDSSSPLPTWVAATIRYAIFAGLLYMLYRAGRWLVQEARFRRRVPEEVQEVDFDVLADPAPLVEEMRRDAGDQYELLLQGDPRNAIVACWDRFEDQAERVGVGRQTWETSSEFTIRLLDAVSADSAAVSRLARLYHEARFSTHPITEEHRVEALEALQQIQASVAAPSAVTS
jgi:hypothetical protein